MEKDGATSQSLRAKGGKKEKGIIFPPFGEKQSKFADVLCA